MASDLDYAKMIEIPLNTCKYQTKKGKSLFKKKKIISLINKKLKDEKPKDSHLSDNFNLNLDKNEGEIPYKELMPLYDLFKVGYTFNHYDRDEILTKPLYNKNGEEIGYSLKDLSFNFQY